MAKKIAHEKTLYAAPFILGKRSTGGIMLAVAIALLPAAAWGLLIYGWPAAQTLGGCLAACLAFEILCGLCRGQKTLFDGSALVTGLLLGLSLPAGQPLNVCVYSSFFAVVATKWAFGGLGSNWANPALAGRAFALAAWPQAMSQSAPLNLNQPVVAALRRLLGLPSAAPSGIGGFSAPIDAGSSATPLSLLKLARQNESAWPQQPLADIAQNLKGGSIPLTDIELFFGMAGGSIGEISTALLLLGALFLLAAKIIAWQAPFACLGVFSLLVWLFGGLPWGFGLAGGDVLFHLCSGGVVLAAFFMVTDTASLPASGSGRLLYGALAGALLFAFRIFSPYPEGAAFAVLAANIFSPAIAGLTLPKPFSSALAKREGRRV